MIVQCSMIGGTCAECAPPCCRGDTNQSRMIMLLKQGIH